MELLAKGFSAQHGISQQAYAIFALYNAYATRPEKKTRQQRRNPRPR